MRSLAQKTKAEDKPASAEFEVKDNYEVICLLHLHS
jgi:hypothetical protein